MIDQKIYEELKNLIGESKVSNNIADRLCFSRDVTPICYKWIDLYKLPPYIADLVVSPENTRDIQSILKIANNYKVKVYTYGGGSGVVGGVIPLEGGITVDMSRMDKVINLDSKSQTVEVEAGIIGQNLEDYLNKNNYALRHFPQSLRSASIGGMVATRSTGQYSTKYGGIENFVVGLEAVLPEGNIFKSSDKPRSSTGPDLNNIFIGSEGIFGIITKVILKIFNIPENMKFQCFLYNDIYTALDNIRIVMQTGLRPAVVRLYNEKESYQKFSKLGFNYNGCLMILCYEGNSILTDAESKLSKEICQMNGGEYIGDELGKLWFENRFDTKHILEKEEEFGGVSDAIELAASWTKIKNLYNETESYFKERNITLASHFSHAYTNGISVYNIFFLNEPDEEIAIDTFYKIWNDIMEIAIQNNATISHHHGIGIIKNRTLKKELGEGFEILKDLKKAMDPNYIMNSDKLINLR